MIKALSQLCWKRILHGERILVDREGEREVKVRYGTGTMYRDPNYVCSKREWPNSIGSELAEGSAFRLNFYRVSKFTQCRTDAWKLSILRTCKYPCRGFWCRTTGNMKSFEAENQGGSATTFLQSSSRSFCYQGCCWSRVRPSALHDVSKYLHEEKH